MNRFLSLLLMLFLVSVLHAGAQPQEKVCGDWESAEGNLRIRVYLEQNQFRARVTWFSDTDGKPMDYWTDVHNPDRELRSRKLLGLSVLSGLQYDPAHNSWENGTVYDSRHGRYWNAAATIDDKNLLHVRGYWHFKWIGKTMIFHRIP